MQANEAAAACWQAIAGAFHLETVEACIIEFETGGRAQLTQEYVNVQTLRGQFKQIYGLPLTRVLAL